MLLRDAQWLYGWGEQWTLEAGGRTVATPGTPVTILGPYPFGTPPAWLSLDALASPRPLTTGRAPAPASAAAAAGSDR
jgi:hypothetical protein